MKGLDISKALPMGKMLLLASVIAVSPATLSSQEQSTRPWIKPGDDGVLPARAAYENDYGMLGLINADGDVSMEGHPFFEALGSNGRGCVTCHQPSDGMSVSLTTIRERWEATGGMDSLFAAIDGRNCPNLPRGDKASHSLMLERGLFRVFLPWPARAADGSIMDAEFDIEVVRDPTGCNTHPEYGLESDNPMISVYRRPRPVANLRYVASDNFGVGYFIGKNGQPAARNPDTGKPVNMNLMTDAREATLRTQAMSASHTHLQMPEGLTKEQLDRIEAFERQLYAVQDVHSGAGSLAASGYHGLGVEAMRDGEDGVLGNNTTRYVFPVSDAWREGADEESLSEEEQAFRASVARGHDVFFFRTFMIRDSMHLNTVGLGNPVKRTCATCHGGHMTGLDAANGWMDIGTTNLPWANEVPLNPWEEDEPDLPLFKLTCHADVDPHPFLGRVIYTQDPGRALISGRCDDIGTIVIQQMRALSARAPYFSNGSAQTLRELVDFYDRRYNIGYSEQERQDLVTFLSTL